jgi:mannose-6-phosphate isomerase-like protein (cupin superfamily)
MVKYKIDFEEIQWEEPIKGINSKIYKYDNRQLRLVNYTKEVPPHWCDKGHYGFILEGEFEIEFENETQIFRKGDGVFIPDGKHHKHQARALSESVKLIFVEDI